MAACGKFFKQRNSRKRVLVFKSLSSMCRLSGGVVSYRQSAAEAGGSVTPRHVRHDATCRAKDAPTTGVDALPTFLFFSRIAVDALRIEKFEVSPYSSRYNVHAARAYDRGRKRRGFALEFELAEVERNPVEVQHRLQHRFCLEKVRPHVASSRLRVFDIEGEKGDIAIACDWRQWLSGSFYIVKLWIRDARCNTARRRERR